MSVIGNQAAISAPLDDQRMLLRAREMAIYLQSDGKAKLQCPSPSALGRAMKDVRGKCAGESAEGGWFLENGRLLESMQEKTPADRLPASGRLPRIQRLMREILCHSDGLVREERLLACVRAFDEVRALTMREIWLAPAALKAECMRLFVMLSRQALSAERERALGEAWAYSGGEGKLPERPSPAFLERALTITREMDDDAIRARVEGRLSQLEIHADSAVRSEYERQALMKMYLSNGMSTLRMLENIDWKRHFALISPCERALLTDPAGTYAAMDEESRAVIRRDAAQLAQTFEISELAVVEQAVQAAEEAEGKRDAQERETCYYLHCRQGREALSRRLHIRRRLDRRPVDPDGRKFALVMAAGTMACLAIFLVLGAKAHTIFVSLPIIWLILDFLCKRVPHSGDGGRLLKMRVRSVPDAWRTLVTMPVMLSDEAAAEEAAAELHALACLSQDRNIDFLLLGDLPPAPQAEMPTDAGIVAAAQAEIARANAALERAKCHFLCRSREEDGDGQYCARERKRGALESLNLLLLGEKNVFSGQYHAADVLQSRKYQFVITLDAGTRLLPEALEAMIGAMAHPLNRQYALLQPRMETDAARTPFARRMSGQGGSDAYDCLASDFFQSMAGEGSFGGKGIYDIRRFHERTAGKIRPNTVLSHDMLEGIFSGCGYLGDVVLYESFPACIGAYLARSHRWIRGDWQLIPYLGRVHSVLGRYRIVDNLFRSLSPICAMALYFLALLGRDALAAAILTALCLAFAIPFSTDALWGLAMKIWLLPVLAVNHLDAILRSLWRMTVSHRHMLEWKTARDAEKKSGMMTGPFFAAAGLSLYGGWWGLPLCCLWAAAPFARKKWEEKYEKTAAAVDREAYLRVARATWQYFVRAVGPNGLPCDNIQIDPPCPEQTRTSPTNIGLYLTACVAAWRLSIISAQEALERAKATAESVESLEKWEGQLYNWYDVRTCAPLEPRYVSAVDGGNLAAALICASGAFQGEDKFLSQRLMRLAEGMRFETLFDSGRKLFCIGMDVTAGRLSASHYDLLCSEARILYYVSAMLGKTPCESWKRLSRVGSAVSIGGGNAPGGALLSWSGTMFEYLMPDLFLRVQNHTLLGETRKTVIRLQQAQKGEGPFWGISESGYYAFDEQNQYQYQAFGLEELSLRGGEGGNVRTPYASLLACEFDPKGTLANIAAMEQAGLMSELGFFEAMDGDRVVKSHMSHHQGMILAAICNLLAAGSLRNDFMKSPRARAIELLLEEKPVSAKRLPKRRDAYRRPETERSRTVRNMRCAPGAGGHLLYGGGSTLFLTSTGAGYCSCRGVMMNRRSYDQAAGDQGFFTHLNLDGQDILLSGDPRYDSRAAMDAGFLEIHTLTEKLEARLSVFLSPEDGAMCRHLMLKNRTVAPVEVEVTDAFAVSLSAESAYLAHPAFQNLFVSSSRPRENALLFTRQPREKEEPYPSLVYVASGGEKISCESDLYALTGRRGRLNRPGVLASELTGSVGSVLNPCAAIRLRKTVPAGGAVEMSFAAVMCQPDQVGALVEKYSRCESVYRARELAQTQSASMLRFLGVDGRMYRLMQKAASRLIYPRAHTCGKSLPDGEDMATEELWPMGLSGELPILLCHIRSGEDLTRARESVCVHGFYRAMGLWCDLVLAYSEPEEYHRPLRDALAALTAANPALRPVPGGARVVDWEKLDAHRQRLLRCAAAMIVESGEPLASQWRRSLKQDAQDVQNTRDWTGISCPSRIDYRAPGFLPGGGYEFTCSELEPAPAPWINICANEDFGFALSERGGGFLWSQSSRSGRLIPYENDPLMEGFAQKIYVRRGEAGEKIPLYAYPGSGAGRMLVRYEPGVCRAWGECGLFSWEIMAFVPAEGELACHDIRITAGEDFEGDICFEIDWLLCAHPTGRNLTRTGFWNDFLWARGGVGKIAFAAMTGGRCRDERTLESRLRMKKGEVARLRLHIGCAETAEQWESRLSTWNTDEELARLKKRQETPRSIRTPDARMNAMLNVWLPCQTEMSRLRARSGFYQPGGAYGFRDQLQDMLPRIGIDDEGVRAHLLLCGAHQFEDGDVQHWWHAPRQGVRTRISDDMLFLPYVAVRYVAETGDAAIWEERLPFLKNVEIGPGEEDWYGDPGVTEETASFREHCQRAIRRACRFGEHGLALMGGGDWNDGMNRVGRMGRGESVWLTEFLLVTAREFMPYAEEAFGKRLRELEERLEYALEEAWDGEWYLRAYTDDGEKLGSRETQNGCQIDSISQSWAVFAGLKHGQEAAEAARKRLVDRDAGLIRLLDPPFRPEAGAGYICAYPAGVRENGGQYTHAACWLAMAFARLGEAEKAWQLFEMLMPYTHGDTAKKREIYRLEPYVAAGDVYAQPPLTGRGGWSWYTGAAAWLVQVALRELLGYSIRTDESGRKWAKMSALLPSEWEEVEVWVKCGGAEYRLLCRKNASDIWMDGRILEGEEVEIRDDGQKHSAVFPARKKEETEAGGQTQA